MEMYRILKMAKTIMVMDNGLQVCVIITELIMSSSEAMEPENHTYIKLTILNMVHGRKPN